MIRRQIRAAISVTVVLMIVTGFAYPMLVTGIAQLVFPGQANGSLITENGRVIGSRLIGQRFAGQQYFHPRPSAAGAGYDPLASGGTNKGPTDRKLADTLIANTVDSVIASDGAHRGGVPADLATSSGSGLDPDISPASAMVQIARVARARNGDSATVAELVARHIQGRQFGLLGEPRVNVLSLNLALDSARTLGTGSKQ
ncbi:MAG TPA: potassium-transporting ATPase subunit KdpC [Gemmatimonadaceae bacterium]|nr:potassium-transporting ATPase subunit KdpC [Gemmatimonadaceae bacterium]